MKQFKETELEGDAELVAAEILEFTLSDISQLVKEFQALTHLLEQNCSHVTLPEYADEGTVH